MKCHLLLILAHLLRILKVLPSCGQAAHSHIVNPSSNDCQVHCIKLSIDVSPPRSSSDRSRLPISRHLDFVHCTEIYRHTILDIRRSCPRHVAAASNGELAPVRGELANGDGDVVSAGRRDSAIRPDRNLLGGEVSFRRPILLVLVHRRAGEGDFVSKRGPQDRALVTE